MKYIVNKTHAKKVGTGTYKQGQIVDSIHMEDAEFKLKSLKGFKGIILREPLISIYTEPKKKEEKVDYKTKEEKVTAKTKRQGRPKKKKLTDEFLTD